MVDDTLINTNQENSQFGGVKTPECKAISRFNAVTHGILRNSITEYEQEFYTFLIDDLVHQYQPQGVIEEILIERITLNYLKLFRIQKAETEYLKSVLNPRIVRNETDDLLKSLAGKEEVLSEGYIPKVGNEAIEKLSNVYARYETTIENRLFRAVHELERTQRMRKGENVPPPFATDINQISSFGETGQNV